MPHEIISIRIHRLNRTDKSLLFLFFKKESAFFFEKKKKKTFIRFVSVADSIAENNPALAVEASEPRRVDRVVIGRAGGHGDARQRHAGLEIADTRRLA